MKEKYEEKYDAHILTHQRHMLISWLESAKSEKIKAVKKQVVIPTKTIRTWPTVPNDLSVWSSE